MIVKIWHKIIFFVFISLILIFGVTHSTTLNDWQILVPKQEAKKEIISDTKKKALPSAKPASKEVIKEAEEKPVKSKEILLAVPFTAQAPYGEWSDPRQQDGCEEASALMAVAWARGEKLDKAKAKKEILAIAEYEKNTYGSFIDTDTQDTVERIIKGYFKYERARAVENIAIADIKNELTKGNLVLAPCNGRRLGNPNYTPPGPARHMLVIRGYDPIKKEFITNDAGTRKGEGYRYNEEVLHKAIVDYSTGDHEPIKEETKSMIVVWQ